MLFIRLARDQHTSLVFIAKTSTFFASRPSKPFSTSSFCQAGKYIFVRKALQSGRDNTPFLKHAYTNNIKELATNNAFNNTYKDATEITMATNRSLNTRGKLTKAERKRLNKERGAAALLGDSSTTMDKYSTWSREELLQRIQELEQGAGIATGQSIGSDIERNNKDPSATEPGVDSPSLEVSSEEPPKSKDRRPFNFSKYAKRHVAFRVAYFGWPYAGFASQGVVDVKTVESELFNALLAARLIEDPTNCNYSRCGRTDRGVSGLGQVIALTVRSGLPKCSPHVIRSEGDGFDPGKHNGSEEGLKNLEELEAQAGVYWKDGVKRNKDGSVYGELAYLTIINRLLPPDIRIVAWATVPEDFNARFHCSWREYKYFFPRGSIDIDRMRTGASYLLGTHDFRNFCKYDASKTIENYERTVLAISIDPVQDHQFDKTSHQFYQLTLRGTAFLWHQVRCMMAILFSIGNGLEEPEIIHQLMDLKQCPAKPNYDMASELPLVLYDCHFEKVEWQYQNEIDMSGEITPLRLYRAMEDQWSCYMTKSLMYSRMLRQLDQATVRNVSEDGGLIKLADYAASESSKDTTISLGGDLRMFMGKKYAKLMDRKTCLPNDIKAKRHEEKRRLKKALTEGEGVNQTPSNSNL
ncbi:pseudouridine synthase [Mortierella sp. GBAus27b]|nr:tRNA pseudouridine synthase 3 [Mortierella sp. GBA43]KAI8350467.1 pseudouridine synthase [Mortierella sp. GBAus27b]